MALFHYSCLNKAHATDKYKRITFFAPSFHKKMISKPLVTQINGFEQSREKWLSIFLHRTSFKRRRRRCSEHQMAMQAKRWNRITTFNDFLAGQENNLKIKITLKYSGKQRRGRESLQNNMKYSQLYPSWDSCAAKSSGDLERLRHQSMLLKKFPFWPLLP